MSHDDKCQNQHLDSHFEQPGPENDESMAYRLADYCMSGSFIQALNTFAKTHAHTFHEVEGGGEHSLEWFETFKEYEQLVHSHLQTFLKHEGVTAEEASAQCAGALGKEGYEFLDYAIASTEYQNFVAIMLDFKSGKRDLSKWWEFLGGKR